MSYNTRLQNNNTSLEGNNTDLQTILNKINELPSATQSENLDAEMSAQTTALSEQDAMIASITTALEGKAVGSGNTTKRINLNWDEDMEGTCEITYVSNGEVKVLYRANNQEVIEADYGLVLIWDYNDMSYSSNNFLTVIHSLPWYVLIAQQDDETVYLVSSNEQ